MPINRVQRSKEGGKFVQRNRRGSCYSEVPSSRGKSFWLISPPISISCYNPSQFLNSCYNPSQFLNSCYNPSQFLNSMTPHPLLPPTPPPPPHTHTHTRTHKYFFWLTLPFTEVITRNQHGTQYHQII